MRKRVTTNNWRGPLSAAAQCEGKEPFPSGALAYRAAKRMSNSKRACLSIYRCPICGRFHIGRMG